MQPQESGRRVISRFEELRAHAATRRDVSRREHADPELRRKVPNTAPTTSSTAHDPSTAGPSRTGAALTTSEGSGSSAPTTDRIRLHIPGRVKDAQGSELRFVARRTRVGADGVPTTLEDEKRSISISRSPSPIQQDKSVLSQVVALAKPALDHKKGEHITDWFVRRLILSISRDGRYQYTA